MSEPFDRIAERRRCISQRVAELRAELEALSLEESELQTAERVLQRFSQPGVGIDAPRATGETPTNGTAQPEARSDSEQDEDGDQMTLPVMVFKILEEAKAEGRRGVDSSEILATIRRRWRPQFTADQVRPTLWRMVKRDGRLKKRGKLYYLPSPSPEGETEAVGASVHH